MLASMYAYPDIKLGSLQKTSVTSTFKSKILSPIFLLVTYV